MMKERTSQNLAPWKFKSELTQMEEEMERMFEHTLAWPWRPITLGSSWPHLGLGESRRHRQPAIEMYEEKNDVVVKAELPGIRKEDLEVTITDHTLTLKGEKMGQEDLMDKRHVYSERHFGFFERSIEIPQEIKIDKARSTFKDGVLEVHLPKTEETKRKEIEIKVD